MWQRGGDYGREIAFEKERRWKIWPKQLHAGDQVGEREHQVVHLRIFLSRCLIFVVRFSRDRMFTFCSVPNSPSSARTSSKVTLSTSSSACFASLPNILVFSSLLLPPSPTSPSSMLLFVVIMQQLPDLSSTILLPLAPSLLEPMTTFAQLGPSFLLYSADSGKPPSNISREISNQSVLAVFMKWFTTSLILRSKWGIFFKEPMIPCHCIDQYGS